MRNRGKETGLGLVRRLRDEFGLSELGMDLFPLVHVFLSRGHALEHEVDSDDAEHHDCQHEQRPRDHLAQDVQLDVGRVRALKLDALRAVLERHAHGPGRLGLGLITGEPNSARIRGAVVVLVELQGGIHLGDGADLDIFVVEPAQIVFWNQNPGIKSN